MKVVAITLAVAAVAAFGCSSSDKSATGPGGSTSCSVTLSGSQTGTYNCAPVAAFKASTSDSAGFGFQVSASGSQPTITALILWLGTPASGHHTNSDAGAYGGVTAGTAAGAYWYAAAGNIGLPAQGTYDLNLTSVTNPVQTDSGTSYTVHGSLSASLPALTTSGASGTVTVSATF